MNAAQEAPNPKELMGQTKKVHGVVIDRFNDPSAGSPQLVQKYLRTSSTSSHASTRHSSGRLPFSRARLYLKLLVTRFKERKKEMEEPTTI